MKNRNHNIPKTKVISGLRQALDSIRLIPSAVLLSVAIAIAFSFLLPACGKNRSAKFNQYYNQGEQLYLKHCSNCHQKDGSGLGRVYPPLNASDYMENNFETVVCLIRYGKSGEMMVNDKQFNQPMPGVPSLSDLEVAEILTYIYNTWTHEQGIIEVRSASAILAKCQDEN